jgi:hypothetical protein
MMSYRYDDDVVVLVVLAPSDKVGARTAQLLNSHVLVVGGNR